MCTVFNIWSSQEAIIFYFYGGFEVFKAIVEFPSLSLEANEVDIEERLCGFGWGASSYLSHSLPGPHSPDGWHLPTHTGSTLSFEL